MFLAPTVKLVEAASDDLANRVDPHLATWADVDALVRVPAQGRALAAGRRRLQLHGLHRIREMTGVTSPGVTRNMFG